MNDVYNYLCNQIMINHYRDLSEEAGNHYFKMKDCFIRACEELSYYHTKLYEAEKKLCELGYPEYASPDNIEPMDKFEWMGYIMNKRRTND